MTRFFYVHTEGHGMAGDWIKMRSNLDTSPKVLAMATELGLPELHVVGMLWKVWSWADQHSLDGNAIRVTNVTLSRIVGVTGFCAAMRNVGWLDGEDGELTFPRFGEHNGQTAKNRAETAKRVAKHRSETCNANRVTKVLPEKRREEVNPPNPQRGNESVNGSRRKRDKFRPAPADRSESSIKSWIREHDATRIPRDHATVAAIVKAGATENDEDDFFRAVERIARGET